MLRSFLKPTRLTAVLCVALLQGLIYLLLLPPWQHYDEPTHFEYAWLIANQGQLPDLRTRDPEMRKQLATSMLEHGFYRGLPQPQLDSADVWIGVSELGHPPAYYLLVSLPLWFARGLDMAAQLYLARCVSLLLFLLVIAVAALLVRDLTRPGHILRWAVPLALTLLPAFADLMTGVNNEVGAVAAASLLLWSMVRLLRFGFSWRRVTGLAAAAVLAPLTKATTLPLLALIPLVLLLVLWRRQAWRWRWLPVAVGGSVLLLTMLVFEWGDAAYWYRWPWRLGQAADTQVATAQAPLGDSALLLEVTPQYRRMRFYNPLLLSHVRRLAGQTVTVGGWVWADRPAVVAAPGLAVRLPGEFKIVAGQPISVTTEPQFVAWSVQVPPDTQLLHYLFEAQLGATEQQPLRLYLDGAILVGGSWPVDVAPTFQDASAHSGDWAGQRFDNVLRNPSVEQDWPRLRPWIDRLTVRYQQRSLQATLFALLDDERVLVMLSQHVLPVIVRSVLGWFAWGHVRLPGSIWLLGFQIVALAAGLGGLRWGLRRTSWGRQIWQALLVLGLACLLVWIGALMRPLPLLGEGDAPPAGRYALPVLLPSVLALVGGWSALWPPRWRRAAVLVLLGALVLLNLFSIATIWSYYAAAAA